jgi:hypothetical protein
MATKDKDAGLPPEEKLRLEVVKEEANTSFRLSQGSKPPPAKPIANPQRGYNEPPIDAE